MNPTLFRFLLTEKWKTMHPLLCIPQSCSTLWWSFSWPPNTMHSVENIKSFLCWVFFFFFWLGINCLIFHKQKPCFHSFRPPQTPLLPCVSLELHQPTVERIRLPANTAWDNRWKEVSCGGPPGYSHPFPLQKAKIYSSSGGKKAARNIWRCTNTRPGLWWRRLI